MMSKSASPYEPPDTEPSTLTVVLRVLALVAVLYVFLCSIEMLGGAFKLLGKGFAESLVQTTANPFTGLLIGVLATSLVQSSSTVTSLVVGVVAGGGLTIEGAIPMIMGANIGTSITNTIVAMGHMTRAQEFQRAFAGATVHDFFNLFAVAVFLPLQVSTGFLSKLALATQDILLGQSGLQFNSPLKKIVKPTVKFVEHTMVDALPSKGWAFAILVVLSLGLLMFSLHLLVKLMKKILLGRIEVLMHRYVFQHPLRGVLAGTIITILVQSSSVTTSLTVPLLAAGFVTLEQMFPVVLGANVGTTITALLASMVTGSAAALTVALCHVYFNVLAIMVFYPLRAIPIACAKWLGRLTVKSRWYAVAYVAIVFFAIPTALIFLTR